MKSNQKEKYEVKPTEEDFFFIPEVKRGSLRRNLLPCDFPTPPKDLVLVAHNLIEFSSNIENRTHDNPVI